MRSSNNETLLGCCCCCCIPAQHTFRSLQMPSHAATGSGLHTTRALRTLRCGSHFVVVTGERFVIVAPSDFRQFKNFSLSARGLAVARNHHIEQHGTRKVASQNAAEIAAHASFLCAFLPPAAPHYNRHHRRDFVRVCCAKCFICSSVFARPPPPKTSLSVIL